MEPAQGEQISVDVYQVKKAVQALQAYLKSTSSQKQLLDEDQQIYLLFTFWKIPKKDQTIRIPLPHGLHTEATEVCLFTRDEPNMTADQTARFYKKFLTQRGLKNISEVKTVQERFRVYLDKRLPLLDLVIPFKVLKTEYKPFEAKRRLLGNFDIFLSDARIHRRLPSHIGKHFYERKKVPLSVDLESKHVARNMERLIQGTTLNITKKGSCCTVRLAHTGMTTDEIVENIVTAVNTISSRLNMKGKSIKVIHLKSHTSVALPMYTSDLSHLTMLEDELKKARLAKGAQKRKKKDTQNNGSKGKYTDKTGLKRRNERAKEARAEKTVDEDEEIPQLVPIDTPSKKTKLEVPSKTGSKKAPKPNKGGRNLKPRQGQKKNGQKSFRGSSTKKE